MKISYSILAWNLFLFVCFSFSPSLAQMGVREIVQKALEQLIGRIERAGYGVASGEADLLIRRMSDDNDARRLEKALAGLEGVLEAQVSEEATAFAAARKYARRLDDAEWPEFRRKLGGFLVRRGFSYTTVAPVVSEVKAVKSLLR